MKTQAKAKGKAHTEAKEQRPTQRHIRAHSHTTTSTSRPARRLNFMEPPAWCSSIQISSLRCLVLDLGDSCLDGTRRYKFHANPCPCERRDYGRITSSIRQQQARSPAHKDAANVCLVRIWNKLGRDIIYKKLGREVRARHIISQTCCKQQR